MVDDANGDGYGGGGSSGDDDDDNHEAVGVSMNPDRLPTHQTNSYLSFILLSADPTYQRRCTSVNLEI